MDNRFGVTFKELRHHAPFTLLGAMSGIICMLLFKDVDHEIIHKLFYIFHPGHVFLSALVTAALFAKHNGKSSILKIAVIGYVGAVGVATVSDSVIPFLGEKLLGMEAHVHIGFIEGWYIVNPAAVAGILIAYYWHKTHFPHAGHVLLSTWASSFHILMAMQGRISFVIIIVSLVFLFLAVWVPCCVSDIVFPMLFVKVNKKEGEDENA